MKNFVLHSDNHARYPNVGSDGVWTWNLTGKVEAPHTAFHYLGNRAEMWVSEPDLWLHGYFEFDWSDEYAKVLHIDTTTSINFDRPVNDPCELEGGIKANSPREEEEGEHHDE